MRRLVALLGITAVAALATPAHALEVYRWIEGATVVYSDQPPPTGVVLTSLPGREPLPVVTAPDAPRADVPPVEAAPAETAAVPPPPAPDVIVGAGPATFDEILELSGMRPQLPGIVRALAAEYLPAAGQLSEHDTALVGLDLIDAVEGDERQNGEDGDDDVERVHEFQILAASTVRRRCKRAIRNRRAILPKCPHSGVS